ncbi:thioesterase II family protein [Streptomyces sp. NBC_00091]|uniref:thioesterase II family protein n=1 Tax=Streptomyces sp. NBC_00091 TaxID=2975648 RepID=UPI002255B3A5|nr:alpha/beta fold hydrolase [Streptomyces sp. NBC_00091]MCX5381116.1 alpha/beta fold hydrolase [Streptomyces sp. NBC_00091]
MVASPWFLTSETAAAPAPAARVYCFPHAGGNPRTFLGWQPGMDPDAQILAVCPPGRGPRFREPAPASLAELADGSAIAIARATTDDRPFLLFGHSFGAALAFEVARRLDGVRGFAGLVVSGCSAPSLLPTPRVVEAARLEGRAFTEAVGFFGGLPPEVMEDETMQELLLPHLKADFRMVAGYRYRPGAPLAVPVTLLNGTEDPHISAPALEAWSRECAAEPDRHWADGGHFYFEDRPDAVTSVLRPLARDAAAGATRNGDQYVELI